MTAGSRRPRSSRRSSPQRGPFAPRWRNLPDSASVGRVSYRPSEQRATLHVGREPRPATRPVRPEYAAIIRRHPEAFVALEGNLKDFSLADMFRLLANGPEDRHALPRPRRRRGQGLLRRRAASSSPSSNWNRESLGRRLVKAGVISEKQLRQALGLQKIQKKEKAGRRLGQILVDEGYLEQQGARELHPGPDHRHAVRPLPLGGGRSCASSPTRRARTRTSASRVSVENVIMEAVAPTRDVEPDPREDPVAWTRAFAMAAGARRASPIEIHLKPREWMLLCYLHGGRSVRELVELTGYNDFETAQDPLRRCTRVGPDRAGRRPASGSELADGGRR